MMRTRSQTPHTILVNFFLGILCAVTIACARREYYTFPALTGVKAIVVSHGMAPNTVIRDRARLLQIVRFMDMRRRGWYDPRGDIFGTGVTLEFLDDRGRTFDWASIGVGGMYQERGPKDTYPFVRTEPSSQMEPDALNFCRLLGRKLYYSVCGSSDVFGTNLKPWRGP
jgi:hypothetical protein